MVNENLNLINKIASNKPSLFANIFGGGEYANIRGVADFYAFENGCVMVCSVHNLPQTKSNIFAFHIHEGDECEGDFSSAGAHYGSGEHPCHKGDLPPLFSCNGDAFLIFYTDRFTASEIVGKTLIIHLDPDDFTTQPSGNSGPRIACGIIQKSSN